MKEYDDCFIAFIDLLGFKDLVNKKKCHYIYKLFGEIQKEYVVSETKTGVPLIDRDKLKMKVMSDTICVFINALEMNSLAGLVAFCNYFQVRMLRQTNPILTRGAIVRGEIFADGDVTFGPGVSNAYLMEEKTAKYPRIILTKATIDSWKNYSDSGINYITRNTFCDTDAFYSIDYLYLFYGLSHEQEDWKRFALYVREMLDTEVDLSIREKYLYLDRRIPIAVQKCLNYWKRKGES